MPAPLETVRLLTSSAASYRARLAGSHDEIRQAQGLRFEVFNLELNEGLAESLQTGLDRDEFDEVCDHLLVEHLPTGQVIGTYRLQTGRNAAAHMGYYSAQEFDFSPFASIRSRMV